MIEQSAKFFQAMSSRRSVRDFSALQFRHDNACWLSTHANQRHFAVTTDLDVKSRLRTLAEEEERNFYQRRASLGWTLSRHWALMQTNHS